MIVLYSVDFIQCMFNAKRDVFVRPLSVWDGFEIDTNGNLLNISIDCTVYAPLDTCFWEVGEITRWLRIIEEAANLQF